MSKKYSGNTTLLSIFRKIKDEFEKRSIGFEVEGDELVIGSSIGGSGMHVYSDEEHVVGVWKVGGVEKPVYEKVLSINAHGNGNSWIDTDIPNNFNAEIPINSFAINTKNETYPVLPSFVDDSITIMHFREGTDVTFKTLIIQYTKTTD